MKYYANLRLKIRVVKNVPVRIVFEHYLLLPSNSNLN